MKAQINIEYFSGEAATYLAAAPEFAKWEIQTKKSITEMMDGVGVWDLLFLGYHAMKREAGGKPVKPFEVWMETVEGVKSEKADDSPKATPSEA